MSRQNYVFTSESVSEGHPDKVCDRISDAVLDAFLAEEPEARVAAETFATTNRVVIGGEVGLSDQDKLEDYMGKIDEIARACIKDIGYEQDKFHHETVEITNLLHEQSAHIAQGVDATNEPQLGIHPFKRIESQLAFTITQFRQDFRLGFRHGALLGSWRTSCPSPQTGAIKKRRSMAALSRSVSDA